MYITSERSQSEKSTYCMILATWSSWKGPATGIVKALVTLTLVACSPPGSSVHRILQQEYWSGLPFPSAEDLPHQGLNPGLLHCRWNLNHLSHHGRLWLIQKMSAQRPWHPVPSLHSKKWKQWQVPYSRKERFLEEIITKKIFRFVDIYNHNLLLLFSSLLLLLLHITRMLESCLEFNLDTNHSNYILTIIAIIYCLHVRC